MPAAKKHAGFRFYGSLNDFLPAGHRQSTVRYAFWGRPAIKAAIEAQGVPHPEVDLILVDGTPVSFQAALAPGERVSVYPWIQCVDRPDDALLPPLPSPLRFVCDAHLGRLARYLRMLGFDTRYASHQADANLARLSDVEHRLLLTRDVELLKRGRVELGYFVRSEAPKRQLAELAERFDLGANERDAFSRCLDCNVPLDPAEPDVVADEVPPHARRVNDVFRRCPACETVYWNGTHVKRMRRLMQRVLNGTVA